MQPNRHESAETERAKLKQEWDSIKDLEHDHVVRYFDFQPVRMGMGKGGVYLQLFCALMLFGPYLACLKEGLRLYMQYCPNGTLKDYVTQNCPINSGDIARHVAQILLGLNFLHSKSIVHQDIKCDNVFLDDRMNARLGDFGKMTKILKPE